KGRTIGVASAGAASAGAAASATAGAGCGSTAGVAGSVTAGEIDGDSTTGRALAVSALVSVFFSALDCWCSGVSAMGALLAVGVHQSVTTLGYQLVTGRGIRTNSNPVIASEAKQSSLSSGLWIASALTRLAMTIERLQAEPVLVRQRLERDRRACPDMLDHFRRRQRAEPRRGAMVLAARMSDQEAGREQIAGAGRIRHFLDWHRRHHLDAVARDDDAALGAARHHCELGVISERLRGRVEIRRLVQRMQLMLVGKEDVDRALADEIEEF